MRLPSRAQFVDGKVKRAFEKLKFSTDDEKRFHEWLVRAFEDIEKNAFCGIQIPKKLIPKQYLQKFKIKNLWKYNLPNAWRLLYSLEQDKIIYKYIIKTLKDYNN